MLICTDRWSDCTEMSGIVDTDDFMYEEVVLTDVLECIKNGIQVSNLDGKTRPSVRDIADGIFNYLIQCNGLIERDNLMVVIPKIDIECMLHIKEMHIWFKGYYYHIEYDRGNTGYILRINKGFEQYLTFELTHIRQLCLTDNNTLCLGVSSESLIPTHEYVRFYLRDGDIIFNGKYAYYADHIRMSKTSFKRAIFNKYS